MPDRVTNTINAASGQVLYRPTVGKYVYNRSAYQAKPLGLSRETVLPIKLFYLSNAQLVPLHHGDQLLRGRDGERRCVVGAVEDVHVRHGGMAAALRLTP